MASPSPANSSERDYDIVVYGATGFTGKLTAEYLVNSKDAATLKLAIAGRNPSKLEACKQDLESLNSNISIGVIQADSDSLTSLKAMAAQTKVVITTVGPYLKYGELLV